MSILALLIELFALIEVILTIIAIILKLDCRRAGGGVATVLEAGCWQAGTATAQRDAAADTLGLATALAALAAGGGDPRRHFIILEHSMILHLRNTNCFTVHMLSQCSNALSMVCKCDGG